MAKCETDCRDELYTEINKKADRSGIWKFTSIIIGVVAIIWGIIFLPFEESRKQTNINTIQIMKLTTILEEQMKLTTILEAQSKSNERLTKEVRELIEVMKK